MLRMDGKNINFNGVSLIEDTQIASMSASYSGQNVYFSINIDNLTLYKANADAVDADVASFKETVIEAL